MNITLSGTKVSMDGHTLAFQKNNLVDSMVITVDTDETWQYKLDVKYPCKDSKGEQLYNVIDLTRVGNTCTAILQAAMLPFNGKYTMQLRGISGDKVYHTDTFDVWVKYSIEPGSTYDPVPSEFYQIENKIDDKVNEAKQYAENAEIASTRMPKISSDNTWLIWDVGTGDYVDTGIKAIGVDGKDGENGITPHIDETTKHWMIGNTDTGIVAEGQDGADGYTPVRGTDYWTDTDKAEIIQSTKDSISIPTKTSQLENDSGFLTQHQTLKTINGQSIVGSGNIEIQGGSGGSNPHAEVITPTKLLKAQNEQYCKSYYMYDFEDIKNVRVICKQAFNGIAINHHRTGDIQYLSAVCLYKDANNFLSILFNGYKLTVRNKKAGTVLNEVELGTFMSGSDSLNTPSTTCWCAEIDLQNKVARFLRMLNGQLVTYKSDNGTVDISEWDLSHLDSFNIVFGCSEYQSDSFCYYCSINDRLRIADYLTQPIEYAKHNCFNTYVANTVKPLTVTESKGDFSASNAIVGTLVEEWDNIHKKFSYVGDTSYRYIGLGCLREGTNHKGMRFVARVKFTAMSDDFKITYGVGALTAWVGDTLVNSFLWGTSGQYWRPEDGVVYDLVSSYEESEPSGQYMYKAIGSFTVEILDMYYMTPQSANICGETYDGTYFRGAMPFAGINVKFNNDYSRIDTSRTGLGIPKFMNYFDEATGKLYMYTGNVWKQISNS